MPYLVQYNFKNGWRDTQLSRMSFQNELPQGKDGATKTRVRAFTGKSLSVFQFDECIEKLRGPKGMDRNGVTVLELEQETYVDDCCFTFMVPIIKVVELTDGRPLPKAKTLYWWGKWCTKTEFRKALAAYINYKIPPEFMRGPIDPGDVIIK